MKSQKGFFCHTISIARSDRSRSLFHLAALALFTLIAGAANALAADRIFLGDAQDLPLAANANPDTVKTLNELRKQAKNNGAARIIVGVRAAFAPEGLMSASNVALQRNEIASAHSAVLDKVPSLKQKPEKIKRFEFIPFMAIEADPAELETLASLPEITSIEEDRLAAPSLAQSVPLIGGATAWGSGYTGAGQTVAILDTGVDKIHTFLTNKVISEACYSSTYAPGGSTSVCPGGVTSSTAAGSAMPYAGTCPAGECDHGTHVAGIVAGAGVSYSGVAKDALLIAIQVFSRFDGLANCSPCAMSYSSDQILGLQRVYALRNTYNIAAVNMSLGGGRYYNQSACDSDNLSTKTAIDNLRSVNIATVISSGNDHYSDSMGAPGCISSAVSVGATWDTSGWICDGVPASVDQIACYSNSVSFLNLLAPGSAITSSIPGGGYATWHGTSMATPHAAGAWAIMKQKNTGLTVGNGLNILGSTGVSVTDTRNGIVKPRIKIDAALNAICNYSLSSTGLSTGAAAAIGNIGVTVTSGCAWTAVSSAGWITVTSGASGNGNGTVAYSVAANTGFSPRSGTMTIAGQTFTVTQAGTGGNVALASAGAVASASSAYSNAFPVAAINDNQRTGAPWGSGGCWADATTNTYPDWVQINFSGSKTIDSVAVYTLQDNYASPAEPTDTMTFSIYGITDFTVQGWNGSAWVTLGTVTGNNLVKRTVTFPAYTTDRIRVNVTGALTNYSRVAEVEAWGVAASPDTTAPTVPTGLVATAASSSQINLSWTASTDAVGVTAYKVYRGGSLIATPGNVTSYSNTGLTASTLYSYTVAACDAAPNCSAQSTAASATTLVSSTNVALASAGAVASASSAYSNAFPVAAINDNQRTGAPWGSGGCWADATTNTYPDWVQINFSGSKTIDSVAVYTLQDNYASPAEPTDTMTFSIYGITDFTVQGWNGSAWVTLGTVTGNNLVKRTVTFPAYTTDRIRVNVTGALTNYSRVAEVEAWGVAASPDTTAPTVPTGLVATAASSSQINLSWTASTDAVGVTAYKVYRGGSLIATPGNVTSYSNTGLTASTLYSYTVAACDAAPNCSAQSTAASATTLVSSTNVALASAGAVASASSAYSNAFPVAAINDNQRTGAPWGSGGCWADATTNTYPDWVQINFSGSKTIDSVAVYTLQDNYASPAEPTDTMTFSIYGITDFTVQGWNGSAWVTLGTVTGNNLVKRTVTFPAYTTDRIRVNVTGALTNYSRVAEVEAWGVAASPDTTAPTVPTGLVATAASSSQINLSWTASTDAVGVTAYKVYRGGSLIATPGNVTSYSNTGLTASTLYSYTVAACDAAPNCSAQSTAASATTLVSSTNVALASAGAVASASSAYSNAFPVAAINDNQRTGAPWGSGGCWADATTNTYPDWVQINFSGSKTIDSVAVYTLQDNYASPAEPTDTMTFSIYGITDFTVQGWNGSAWVTLGTVTGNNLVKRTVTFPAYTTDRIRVNVTGALTNYSRVAEVEAWGVAASPDTTPPNDNFMNRIAITSAVTTGSNVGASKEAGEPNHVSTGGASVWWSWTATTGGTVTITTSGSSFDTLLAVYTGTSVNALTLVASNDDGGGTLQSSVSFSAITGQTYQIAVDGYSGASGTIVLNVFQVGSPPTNVALASAGAVASASSAYSNAFPVAAINDNQRTGAPWGSGGCWADATTNTYPDWVQINFSGSKTIDSVAVYTLQDNYASPAEPTDTMTFSIYGITDFTVQGWNGSAWVTLGTVTGNNLVKRTVTFPAYTTDRIRVNVTGALTNYSRVAEVEAWGS